MRIAFSISAAILPPRGNNENNPSWPPLRRNNDFVYIIKYSRGPSAFQPNTTERWVEQDLIEARSTLPIVVTNSNVNKIAFSILCAILKKESYVHIAAGYTLFNCTTTFLSDKGCFVDNFLVQLKDPQIRAVICCTDCKALRETFGFRVVQMPECTTLLLTGWRAWSWTIKDKEIAFFD